MGLAAELKKASRIRLAPGQRVIVRTKTGERVVDGYITTVDVSTGTVRVETDKSGADLQVDVDTDQYDLWVQPPPEMGSGRLGRSVNLFVRPSSPGIYTGGRF